MLPPELSTKQMLALPIRHYSRSMLLRSSYLAVAPRVSPRPFSIKKPLLGAVSTILMSEYYSKTRLAFVILALFSRRTRSNGALLLHKASRISHASFRMKWPHCVEQMAHALTTRARVELMEMLCQINAPQ